MSADFDMGLDCNEIHGLFVGIDDYPVTQGRHQLDGCANDATELCEAMGPALTSTKLLTNEQATRQAILDNAEQILAEAKPKDLFLFFCACHGETRYGEFFLLPHDYDQRAFLGTALLFQDIANSMGSNPNINTLTILDACHSAATGFDPSRHSSGQRSSIMAAAAPLEYSLEFLFEETSHGAFAFGLIQQLNRVFEKGGPGSLTIAELFRGAYHFTKANTKEGDDYSWSKQHPVMVGTLPASLKISATGGYYT